jgi:UDP-GlcNAc3NAcA epimerase
MQIPTRAPLRLLSIVGARPQFIKAAVICRAIARQPEQVQHILLNTGQHYDVRMSDIFFQELGIPRPDYNLEVGSGTHGHQTAETIRRLEPILLQERPDWVMLYGDTNATISGAVAAAKLPNIRIAHLEAGLRSFNRAMPEEINRITADHLSHLLLCPTRASIENLDREGLADRAVLTGDVMYDCVLAMQEVAGSLSSSALERWRPGAFALATVHRQENTDHPTRLRAILNGLEQIAKTICPVLLPLHPRTLHRLNNDGWKPSSVECCQPLSYCEMITLEARARFILTDSGGVQKEAYFVRVPCITLRDETEWVETLENGCNVLVGADEDRIVEAAGRHCEAGPWNPHYGEGHAAEAVLRAIEEAQESVA